MCLIDSLEECETSIIIPYLFISAITSFPRSLSPLCSHHYFPHRYSNRKASYVCYEKETYNEHPIVKFFTFSISSPIGNPFSTEAGGLDVAWFIVYTGQGELSEEGFEAAYNHAMMKFIAIHKLVNELAPYKIGLDTTSDKVRKIHHSGKKVAMIRLTWVPDRW